MDKFEKPKIRGQGMAPCGGNLFFSWRINLLNLMSTHSASGGTGRFSQAKTAEKSRRYPKTAAGLREPRKPPLALHGRRPASIAFKPTSTEGTATLTSANNSSTSTELSFLVSGVTAGDTVNVYADGGTTAIATGTVASRVPRLSR